MEPGAGIFRSKVATLPLHIFMALLAPFLQRMKEAKRIKNIYRVIVTPFDLTANDYNP